MEYKMIIPENWDKKLGHLIKVIGVGGGGCNAVQNMYEKGIKGVDFIICNTDAQVLYESTVPNVIQIGKILTDGLGTGCNPDKGREAAIENLAEIEEILSQNTKMLFIATGLGGGTGTGASPIIAKAAKDRGILTVAIATLPFRDEGDEPYNRAMAGLDNLKQNVDSLLLINSQKLYEQFSDMSVFEAFPEADKIVTIAAKSIAELITIKGYINMDFADVKMAMFNSGMALMGHGKSKGENRIQDVAQQALNSPLLDSNNISGAKNILVNITSGKKKNPLKMTELYELMNIIAQAVGGSARNIKRGVTLDPSLDDETSEIDIAVTIVATGFADIKKNSNPPIVPEPTPTPTPDPTPEPEPEPAPEPTPTPEPTPEPEPAPEPTPTPEPTPEPEPEPAPEPTPTPDPIPEPTPTPEPKAELKPSVVSAPISKPQSESASTPEPAIVKWTAVCDNKQKDGRLDRANSQTKTITSRKRTKTDE
jgi:cell division protein FtsZ